MTGNDRKLKKGKKENANKCHKEKKKLNIPKKEINRQCVFLIQLFNFTRHF
jgi:hypothetical protein